MILKERNSQRQALRQMTARIDRCTLCVISGLPLPAINVCVSLRTDPGCFVVYFQGSSSAGELGVGGRKTAHSRLQMAAGIAMRQVQPSSQLHDIVHPTCPKCGASMWLTRIAPDGPGWEQRTFECQACQNEPIDVVRGDRHDNAK